MTTSISLLECLIGVVALIALAALAGYVAGVNVEASVQHVLAHVFSQASLPPTN